MTLQLQDYSADEYKYEKPDKVAVFHEHDEILDTIVIDLPVLEEFYSKHLEREISYEEAETLVDGYGLPRSEQYFRYVEQPEKLQRIYINVARNNSISVKEVKQEMLYEEIETNRDIYKEDILFIQREIFRRFNGYWFFNNGKPTYITGWHYFFLNYWKLNNSGENEDRPYYRDKQRRMAIFYLWTYTYDKLKYKYVVNFKDTNGKTDFKYFNERRSATDFRDKIRSEGGVAFDSRAEDYFIGEAQRRTIHGITQPKTRREGYTAFVCCFMFCIITDRQQMNAWIQALTEDDSEEKIFRQIMVEGVYKLPFYFTPFHNNEKSIKPAKEYVFTYPNRLQMAEMAGEYPKSLGSVIKPFSSAYRKIDGTRAGVLYRDECGKMTETGNFTDIEIWWSNVAKRTVEFGKRIVGFAMLGSTVGDMSGGGGASYKKLCEGSHANKSLGDNGTTRSGLINLFFPAYDGMQGFIDKFGMSVIEDPPFPIMGQDGVMITEGAKRFLQNNRNNFLIADNQQGYINEVREMPWTWEEAWTESNTGSAMPIISMRKRHSELSYLTSPLHTTYSLDWIGGVRFGKVKIVEDPSGKWIFLKEFVRLFEENSFSWMNQKTYDYYDDTWIPALHVANRIYAGVDPFRYDDRNSVQKKSKRSKGACGIYWPDDEKIDLGKVGVDRLTEDYMGFFNYRLAEKEQFAEEMAKAAICFGLVMNVENNEMNVVEFFQKWKLDGYIPYDSNIHGVEKPVRGVRAEPGNKQNMFSTMETFFSRNAYRVKIPHILDAWMRIPTPGDLPDHDLCAATGWAIEAFKRPADDVSDKPTTRVTVMNQVFS